MSSCKNKNVNIEKYATPPRTAYDQLMAKVYDPEGRYFAAPFPMRRTNADLEVQQRLAPKCGYGFVTDVPTKEGYANPPRTHYDQLMAKVYSPDRDIYFGAPFPMDRTKIDMAFRSGFSLPPCTNYGFQVFPKDKDVKENYCGGYCGSAGGCGSCTACPRNLGHPALALNDNDNVLSYNATMM